MAIISKEGLLKVLAFISNTKISSFIPDITFGYALSKENISQCCSQSINYIVIQSKKVFPPCFSNLLSFYKKFILFISFYGFLAKTIVIYKLFG